MNDVLGDEPWDGARNLHGILNMDQIPEDMKSYIADYPLHVLDVCHAEDERLMEFPRDIACMFLILKYQKDKVHLKSLLENTEEFHRIGADTYETVWQYTNETAMLEKMHELEDEKGEVKMCQAIREIMEDSRKEGLEQGISQGLELGIQQGLEQGVEQGIRIFILDNLEEQIPRVRIVLKLKKHFGLSEEAANRYYEKYAEQV